MLRGGCFCRAVRYEIDAEPTNQTICHCTMCRHAAGGRQWPGSACRQTRSGSWPASRSASSRRSTPRAPSAPTAARP